MSTQLSKLSGLNLQGLSIDKYDEATQIKLPQGKKPTEIGFIAIGQASNSLADQVKKKQRVVLRYEKHNEEEYFVDPNGNRYVLPGEIGPAVLKDYPLVEVKKSEKRNCISRFFSTIWKCVVNAFKALLNYICCCSSVKNKEKDLVSEKNKHQTIIFTLDGKQVEVY